MKQKVSFSLLCLMLCFALFLPVAAQSQPDFGSFDPARLPVEVQSWWTPAYGHIHMGALFPYMQTVSGIYDLPVRVVLHNNPGTLTKLSVGTDANDGGGTVMNLGKLTCPTQICAWSFTIPVDTTQMPDGWREWRIKAYVNTPDGKRFLTSSGVPVRVENGKPDDNFVHKCDGTSMVGRGWYEGFGYSNAAFECVFTAPVSGIVTFSARAATDSKHLSIDIDKSHYIPAVGPWPEQLDSPGIVLFNRDGNFQDWQRIPFDTRTLANGWHSIAVTSTGPKGAISKCTGCPNVTSFPSGVAKFYFFVNN